MYIPHYLLLLEQLSQPKIWWPRNYKLDISRHVKVAIRVYCSSGSFSANYSCSANAFQFSGRISFDNQVEASGSRPASYNGWTKTSTTLSKAPTLSKHDLSLLPNLDQLLAQFWCSMLDQCLPPKLRNCVNNIMRNCISCIESILKWGNI